MPPRLFFYKADGQSTFSNKIELLPGFISGSEGALTSSDLVTAASTAMSVITKFFSLSLSLTHTTNMIEGLTRTAPKY